MVTARLVLRPWAEAELRAVCSGDRLPGWAPDFPAEGDQVIAGFLAGQPAARGEWGHRLVTEREGGLVVGSIGLFWPPSAGSLEIGYGIVASRRGRGYATEATAALAAHGLRAPGVHTVTAQVETANPASVRVLEKAGMLLVSSADGVARYALGTG
ncbi:GNAT family N-acetyltransferase [Streptomyces sp. SCSIO ZS0520]|uniref:GNAT family N-acetyltransferase n=1 Tax=Streptomyces sp. SCSIO ZS0520 TaxID=2892996 RepID=UPI0021D7DAFB|nr:GNAT family N-acetyltransferase [Streptomyces sp. SCSIO ZS0520]